MALQRKRKLAQQLGIDVDKLEEMNIDPVEFLRAQGDLLNATKEKRALAAIEEKFAKECTFAPDTKKKKVVQMK